MALPRIVGHRGAAGLAPENTLAGLRAAAAAGAGGVEFDVMLTGDDVCVLFHDDRLDRTTDGSGEMAASRFADVARLDAGASFDARFTGERVPTLAQALAEALRLGLAVDLEIKPTPGRAAETAERALAEARSLWPAERPPPLITSFVEASLAVAARIAPDWPRGLIVLRRPRDWRRRLERLGCQAIVCHHERLDARAVARLGEAGVAVLAFTVDEPARAERLFDWGVAAVISDRPDRLHAAGL